jgi:azurin
VKITLINQATDSAMIHNIVFVYDGTRNATATAGLKAGPEKDYVPDLITVIAASSLAKPGETVELEFDAPEVGSYYFICTYPGHWQKMTGVFIVTALAE